MKPQVSQTPVHMGEGYSWGGDWIVTINGLTLNCGANGERVATLIAEAPVMAGRIKDACDLLQRLLDEEAVPESMRPELAVEIVYLDELLNRIRKDQS